MVAWFRPHVGHRLSFLPPGRLDRRKSVGTAPLFTEEFPCTVVASASCRLADTASDSCEKKNQKKKPPSSPSRSPIPLTCRGLKKSILHSFVITILITKRPRKETFNITICLSHDAHVHSGHHLLHDDSQLQTIHKKRLASKQSSSPVSN